MKKLFSLLNVFVFFIVSTSPGFTFPLNRKDNPSEITDGSSPLTAKALGKLDKTFYEDALSDEGLSSAFRVFGLERKKGIELLVNNLPKHKTLQQFVSNSMHNEPMSRFRDIFRQVDKTRFKSTEDFYSDIETQMTYLNFFKNDNHHLEVEENCDQEGAPINNQRRVYGLMDALARIQNKSLYIYTSTDKTNCIRLGHAFYLEGSQERIDAICRGQRFNLLVLGNDEEAQKRALKQEIPEITVGKGVEQTPTPKIIKQEPLDDEEGSEEPEEEQLMVMEEDTSSRREDWISGILRDATPDRSSPLPVKKRPETFYKYFTSGDDNSCGFRIFGLERSAGIELIKYHMFKDVVHKYIANTISTETEDRFYQIFGTSQDHLNLNEFSRLPHNQLQYLNFLKTDRSELEITKNCKKDGSRLNMVQPEFGLNDADACFRLINALAYIQGKSLYIYQESKTPGYLKLAHRFPVANSKERLTAHFSGRHYSLMALANDPEANEKALQHELKNLEILRQQTLRESPEVAESSRDPGPIERTIPLGFVKKEERFEEDDDERHFRFTEEDFVNFIDRKKGVRSLPGMHYLQSLRQSYLHCRNQIERLNIQPDDNRHIPYLFGIARLMFEFEYYPDPSDRNEHAENLLGDLQNIIRTYKTSRESKLRRFANYARIYAGKALMTLNRLDDAYKTFMKVEEGYTKTYLIDIAQMILEYGYRPDEIGNNNPIDYARGLLEEAKCSSPNRSNGSLVRPIQPRAPRSLLDKLANDLAHPLFLNRDRTKNRHLHLTLLVRERASDSPDSTDSPPTLSGRRNSSRKRSAESINEDPPIMRAERAIKRERLDRNRISESTDEDTEASSRNHSRKRSAQSMNGASPETGAERAIKRERLDPNRIAESTDEDTEANSRNGSRKRSTQSMNGASPETGKERSIKRERLDHDRNSESTDDETVDDTLSLMPNQRQDEFRRLMVLGYTTEDSETYLQRGLNLSEEMGDVLLQIQARLELGNYFAKNRKDKRALECFEEVLTLAQEMSHIFFQARAHIGIGNARGENSVMHFNTGYELAKKAGDKKLMAQARIGLGNHLAVNRVYKKDLECFKEGLQLAVESGDTDLQAQAHIAIGNARGQNGPSHYTTAYKLAKRSRNKKLMSKARIGLGNFFSSTKNGKEALKHFKKGLRLAEECRDIDLQAQAHIGMGKARGENDIAHFSTAYELAKRIGNKKLMAKARMGRGNHLAAKHNDKGARECFEEVLTLVEENGDIELQARAHIGIGLARGEDFRMHFNAGYELGKKIGDKKLMAQAHLGLGHRLAANHNDEEARKCFKEVLTLAQESHDIFLESQAYIGMGNARGENEEGHYITGYELAKRIGDIKLMAQARIGLGNHFAAKRNNEEALKCYREALSLNPPQDIAKKAQGSIDRMTWFLNLRSESNRNQSLPSEHSKNADRTPLRPIVKSEPRSDREDPHRSADSRSDRARNLPRSERRFSTRPPSPQERILWEGPISGDRSSQKDNSPSQSF